MLSQIIDCNIDVELQRFSPGMRMLDDKMYRPAADKVDITRTRYNNERKMERGKREQKTAGPVHDRIGSIKT
jgi:hypothetical protein